MIKSKKQMFIVIGIFMLVILVGTVTYAFFNYTRTGASNTIRVGRIAFNTIQKVNGEAGSINLTNIFPIARETATTDTINTGEVVIEITGDTDYTGGVEYLVTATDVTNTTNGKTLPISIIATASEGLGISDDNYFDNRNTATGHIYKVLANDTISNNEQLMVGYIKNGATGINGTLTIKAFIDVSKVVISDTYNDGNTPTDEKGTPISFGEGKTVLTTTEWNSLQTNGISFKVKVEANEGIWVEEPLKSLGDTIISKLGQDGIVAINTSGALASTGDTIREYRYSGGGRYCEYENGETTYKFQIEENTCPETVVFGGGDSPGGPPGLYSPTSDAAAYRSGNVPTGTTYTLVSGTGIQEGTVKNYITFNGEMWRIIGVFDGKVKLMKDLPIITADAPASYTGLNNISYTILLNSQPTYANAKYPPIVWNSDSSNTGNNWAEAGLQYWLNEDNTGSYYNSLNATAKNLIVDDTYYLNNVNSSSYGTVSSVYNEERETAVGCAASVTSNSENNSCNIWNGNAATWTGKIALPYSSDFGYAAESTYYERTLDNYWNASNPAIQGANWFLNNDAYYNWFLSPSSDDTKRVGAWNGAGNVGYYGVLVNAVRPVLNLSSNVLVESGNGSYSEPYTIKLS